MVSGNFLKKVEAGTTLTAFAFRLLEFLATFGFQGF